MLIEDGRYLAFEYIGAADHLHEAKPGIDREGGGSVRALTLRFVTAGRDGGMEVALTEWTFTES